MSVISTPDLVISRVFRAPREMQVEVRSGIDWFELHGRVDFGDGNTASLPALLAAFERGDGTVVLDDGTRGLVPEEWLQRFAGIVSFGETDGEFVRYRKDGSVLSRLGNAYVFSKGAGGWRVVAMLSHDPAKPIRCDR